eukprot:TCONS_00023253-protein
MNKLLCIPVLLTMMFVFVSTANNQECKDGRDGRDGKDGKDGRDGKDGVCLYRKGIFVIKGEKGKDGRDGKDGKDGVTKNWKECAWNKINEYKDSGVIKSCDFKKESRSTHLKVFVSSVMRIHNCNKCCKRWFVTFDGQECAPVPIDGIVYMHAGAGNRMKNLHRTRVIAGHCKVSKKNQINVALNVGDCTGYPGGDASTGWNSATRIYIEEVDQPQS